MGESRVNMIGLDDYIHTPVVNPQSFHCRVGQLPSVRCGILKEDEDGTRARSGHSRLHGFPVPGPQCPTPSSAIAKDYFVRESTWEAILDHGNFDFIVIGSSFCALAFITEAYKINPRTKILILERGDFFLPSHFQNLPVPTDLILNGTFETFPWTLSAKTFNESDIPGLNGNYLQGSCPFFGGKSTIWSSWCPRPPMDLLDNFPESMRASAAREDFWTSAGELLNVTTASEIKNGIFGLLQRNLDERLKEVVGPGVGKIAGVTYTESARLAVAPISQSSNIRFTKYSVPGPLFRIFEQQKIGRYPLKSYPLQIAINSVVQRLGEVTGNYVRSIETSRGTISFTGDKTKIILCGGTVPNTTLVLNSFKHLRKQAGRRLTGHFLTHMTARCPKEAFGGSELARLQMGAHYLAGQDPKTTMQYHIHVTATHSPNPEGDAEDIVREAPDFAAAPTKEQLRGSEKSVVFVFATIGETAVNDDGHDDSKIYQEDIPLPGRKGSFVKLNSGPDPTCNVDLQYEFTDTDKSTWDMMDKATFDTMTVLGGDYADKIEYWQEDSKIWSREMPPKLNIRIPGMIHEASTLFMGPQSEGGCVDDNFMIHGAENVYVTGAALFPTPGSWNPTLAICGYAQELARKIVCRN